MNTKTQILLVDDDDVFRGRLAQAFRDRGYVVNEAGDFNVAIDALESSPPLAVFDLCIPGGNGLELLKTARKLNPSGRALILTGYGTVSTAVSALKSGAVNYLTKPTHADAILEALFSEEQNDTGTTIPMPTLDQVEWDHINRVVAECDGNISRASKLLGLHRRSLQRKLAKKPGKIA